MHWQPNIINTPQSPNTASLLPPTIITLKEAKQLQRASFERDKRERESEKRKAKMGFEETELRLGLPGNGGRGSEVEVVRKRGFSETETENDTTENVDLKLNLSSKEVAAAVDATDKAKSLMNKEKNLLPSDPAKPPAK